MVNIYKLYKQFGNRLHSGCFKVTSRHFSAIQAGFTEFRAFLPYSCRPFIGKSAFFTKIPCNC